MNIAYLESFLETAKQRSISKASERLQMTHPALSKQLRSVETYFGATLFKRSPAGVELTEAGKALYARIGPLFKEISALRAELSAMRHSRKIRLGALPSLAAYYLPEKVFELNSRNIEAELVVANTSAELHDMLQSGAIDAAVCGHIPIHPSLWSTVLFEEPFYAVVYSSHPLASRTEASLKELSEEPFILHPPVCQIRQLLTTLMEQHGHRPVLKAEVGFGEFILGYVATGAGIGFVPRIVAVNASNPKLRSFPITNDGARRTVSLFTLEEDLGKQLFPLLKEGRAAP
ncbi:LysR family transcriptional regulator [Cohnella cholangitidis]|uniref:LysR family transcriptional regulator n=1 Tax=Cohnella cholangitidis TaxID=2598458 RepID=UPI0015F988C7|nr:LysR family transcriptional regulator [Cohnella cholangitidis]